ncbi:hypothetical protein DNU06_12210 [Putridiphycobacter roseus]|uniref:DUF4270 domain-containing protein n=1 Tax=Putridiphycobacter roseus TaxID=2219161 RepID=A0A2W1N0X1_9FLAO|nr:DUF4270 family protein [Putridiphycobacter roseus]PZE16611.1 hypothetical protein DNU06_12210 [Putridiphycobacter roseus]
MIKKYKILNQRKVIQLSAGFLISFLALTGCKKEISSIGTDINPNGLNLVKQDTFSILTESVVVDSLPTDETSISLLGAYNDPSFGIVDCGVVTQIRLSSESPNFGEISDITVDSVVLSFLYTGLLNYGTVTDLSFEVFEITDQLTRVDQEYYANTPVNFVNSNLMMAGKEIQKPDLYSQVILADDTLSPMLRLPLKTTFGDYLISNVAQMSSNDNFTSFFKGLYVRVANASSFGENKGTVLYLSLEDALSNLVLYYTIGSENKKFTFNINSNCARFNKMDFDIANTDLYQALNNTEAAQEKIFLQGSHIRSEFQFPYITEFAKDRNIVINKAELVVPVQDFVASPYSPSQSLFIGRIDEGILTSYTYDYSSFTSVVFDNETKTYTFNLTRDLQRVVSGEIENVGYRIYPTSFFGSTIERTVFSGPKANTKEKTKLIITYTEY